MLFGLYYSTYDLFSDMLFYFSEGSMISEDCFCNYLLNLDLPLFDLLLLY